MSELLEESLVAHVARVIAAQQEVDQPGATFRAVEAALADIVGFRVFTVLVHHPALRQHRRVHSSEPKVYPVGDSIPTDAFPLWQRLLAAGEPYIGRTAEDIQWAILGHALVMSLGCESVLSMPVRWAGQTLGSFNLLNAAHWYSDADIPVARLFAQMALPAVMLAARM